ncbi:MAG: carboxypeptidase regulatory-like domain-containing protein, partial [Melioribacteraceae bacterium]|nr:carboxypeptidase regulatory-like domain-containing protein [Melioribacteraceae bacterium]
MRTIVRALLLFVFFFSTTSLAQLSSPQNVSAEHIHFDYAGLVNDAVRVSWDIVTDGGQNVPLYNVYRAEGNSNNVADFKFLGQALWNSHYNDLDVELGKTYTYYVTAKKGETESAPSKFATVTVGDKPPDKDESGVIAGKVTDEKTGDPLEGVTVVLNTLSTTVAETAVTNSEGKYKIEAKPDQYKVYFKPNSKYHGEFYDNVKEAGNAKIITLNDGDDIKNVDAALTPVDEPVDKPDEVATVSGMVMDETDNTPLRGVMVILTSLATNMSKAMTTDSDGKYKLEVKPGDYILYFKAIPGYKSEYWNDKKNE